MDQGLKGYRVLCVDDEPALLALLVDAVRELGFESLEAANGKEALTLVEPNARRLALIISDVVMPEMGGFELRQALLSAHGSIPFVVASGNVTREEALRAVESKISAFIAKPYTVRQIQEVVLKESAERLAFLRDENEMRSGFVTEALALADEMESLLLGLEAAPGDADAINRVFACAHTIKGTSGFFKPDTIHKFTHRYEDFLSGFKRNPGTLDARGVSVLLNGLDTIRRLIADLSEERASPPLEGLFDAFESAVSTQGHGPPAAPGGSAPAARAPAAAQADELRVSLSLLDLFMEKSGELTVLRSMVNKSMRALEVAHPADPSITALSELISETHKVNAYIQDQVVDMRKVSIRHVLKPLARTLRDLGVSLKKKIVLSTSGDEIRVDHTLADALNKCLIHLVRNAADHGLEPAEERRRLKKPPEGRIEILAEESGEEVVVRVKDDGRGIDPDRVKRKAVEKGLLSAEAAARMPDSEARMLIFEPGFSTADQVTDVSGRGVGTDMVKGTILALGGEILLNSAIGQGSEFVLKLPIPKSVMIISSLIVRSDGASFAIPQDSVLHVTSLSEEARQQRIENVGNARFLKDSERLLPILDLGRILGIGAAGRKEPSALVRVRSGARTDFCLAVQEILEIEDTVVRKPGSWFQKIPVYAGATFLGDGGIGLILQPESIASSLKLGQEAAEAIRSAAEAVRRADSPAETLPVLLVDLGTRSRYGANRSEIFRLELLSSRQIQRIGEQPVVIYRSTTMPLFDLRERPRGPSLEEERLSVIVVREEGGFKGFVVDAIRDFVDATPTEKEGVCLSREATITLLDLAKLGGKTA